MRSTKSRAAAPRSFGGLFNPWACFDRLCDSHAVTFYSTVAQFTHDCYLFVEAADLTSALAFRRDVYELGVLKACFRSTDEQLHALIFEQLKNPDSRQVVLARNVLEEDGLAAAVASNVEYSEAWCPRGT